MDWLLLLVKLDSLQHFREFNSLIKLAYWAYCLLEHRLRHQPLLLTQCMRKIFMREVDFGLILYIF